MGSSGEGVGAGAGAEAGSTGGGGGGGSWVLLRSLFLLVKAPMLLNINVQNKRSTGEKNAKNMAGLRTEQGWCYLEGMPEKEGEGRKDERWKGLYCCWLEGRKRKKINEGKYKDGKDK